MLPVFDPNADSLTRVTAAGVPRCLDCVFCVASAATGGEHVCIRQKKGVRHDYVTGTDSFVFELCSDERIACTTRVVRGAFVVARVDSRRCGREGRYFLSLEDCVS